MSEINPNVPLMESQTTTEGKLELNSASSPVTFDELEQVTKEAKRAKKESKDLTSDENKGKDTKAPKQKEETKDTKEAKQSKEESEEKAEEAPKRKTIKAKYNDTEHELDEEALFTVKINGKEETVTARDLMSNYSGKIGWDKKFSELDKFHRGIKSQDLKLQESSAKLKAIFEEKDPAIRMYKMAEISGVNPVEFRQKFFEENIPMLEKWYEMSDDQRKAWKAEQDSQFYKYKSDTLESQRKHEEAQRALKAKIDGLRASRQISEDEYLNHYDQVKDMVNNGQLDADLTPEYVIETVEKSRLWNAAEEKLNELNLMTGNERSEKLLGLVEKAHKLEMSPKEIAEWVDENWGTKKAQKTVEDKKKDREDFISGKKEVQQVKAATSAPLFFDEI